MLASLELLFLLILGLVWVIFIVLWICECITKRECLVFPNRC